MSEEMVEAVRGRVREAAERAKGMIRDIERRAREERGERAILGGSFEI